MPLALRRHDRDLVLLALEADVRARDVVDDDGVEPLALELAAAERDGVGPVLGGEADDGLAGAVRTSSVGSSDRASSGRPSFLILPAVGAAGRKSATAAAMSRTSVAAKASSQAARSSAAVPTST